jgi:hypothetical protein
MEIAKSNLFMQIPKDLKKELLGIAQSRKMNELPNNTITDVVIEFVRQGLEKERKKLIDRQKQNFSDL